MPLSVQRPAVASPEAPPGISVRAFFEEQLSLSPVAFVPKNYDLSGDPKKKLGEEAEEKVFHTVAQVGNEIPGIQIVCFHSVRVIAGCPIILREVDFCLFITYQDRHYIVIKEVKCNANPESSRGTSKKAMSQLKTFKDDPQLANNQEPSAGQILSQQGFTSSRTSLKMESFPSG